MNRGFNASTTSVTSDPSSAVLSASAGLPVTKVHKANNLGSSWNAQLPNPAPPPLMITSKYVSRLKSDGPCFFLALVMSLFPLF